MHRKLRHHKSGMNFLAKGKNVPEAELKDSGIRTILSDFENFSLIKKLHKQQLVDYYETVTD